MWWLHERHQKGLIGIQRGQSVEITLEEEKILIQGEHLDRTTYINKMDSMGYPEKGNNTLFKEAKSYVSCAIGKVNS